MQGRMENIASASTIIGNWRHVTMLLALLLLGLSVHHQILRMNAQSK